MSYNAVVFVMNHIHKHDKLRVLWLCYFSVKDFFTRELQNISFAFTVT